MTRPTFAGVVMAIAASGCVRAEHFRYAPAKTLSECFTDGQPPPARKSNLWPSLDCANTLYSAAFIEFNEKGGLVEQAQQADAIDLIDRVRQKAGGGKIIAFIYAHGWKNNTSEATEGGDPKDVEKFKSALAELAARSAAVSPNSTPVPIVGIYLGWRGKTLAGPDWYTFLSLWSRRNTANHVGEGPDLAPTLNTIIAKVNEDPASRLVLVGHSFGARVLEHAIAAHDVDLYDQRTLTPRVDLTLFVNSADDARISMTTVTNLRKEKIHVRHPDYTAAFCANPANARDARCREYPLLVAVTSRGDWATKYLLPVANSIPFLGDAAPVQRSDLAGNTLDPPPPAAPKGFADPTPGPGAFRRNAAGHMSFLQSHVVNEIPCGPLPDLPPASPANPVTAVTARELQEAFQSGVTDLKGLVEFLAKRGGSQPGLSRDPKALFEEALHPVCLTGPEGNDNCRFVFRTRNEQAACFEVDQRQPIPNPKPAPNQPKMLEPYNTTAFWIMSVDPAVIKDHGDIWNLSFVEMLGQLMAPRGFFEPAAKRIQLQQGT